jgi:hypothetical protein
MKARRQYNYSVHILKPMPLTQYCTYANMCTIMNYLQVPSYNADFIIRYEGGGEKHRERKMDKEDCLAVFRIRIGSGFNQVNGSGYGLDPDMD